MKIRTDFVTNSSSSSFIISKEYLDVHQIPLIYDHINIAKQLQENARRLHQAVPDFGYVDEVERWDISENKYYISGFTIMDNFDMRAYLEAIGVLPGAINWSDSYHDLETKHDIHDWYDDEEMNEKWAQVRKSIKDDSNENQD